MIIGLKAWNKPPLAAQASRMRQLPVASLGCLAVLFEIQGTYVPCSPICGI
jgi:hypothetical protein